MSNELATLNPTTFDGALTLAKHLSDCEMMPPHLRGKPATCLRVVMLAARNGLDAFSVADKTSDIQGKLMYEGQLIGALINASKRTKQSLNYRFNDYGSNVSGMVVTCFGTLIGEDDERSIDLTYDQACKINKNGQMQKNPRQQICYIAARQWSRLHMPEVTMSMYSTDENVDAVDHATDNSEPKNVTGTAEASEAPPVAERPAPPAKTGGMAGAKKAAAAKKTAPAKKAAPKKTAAAAKPPPEPETEVVEEQPAVKVEIRLNEVATEVICKVVETERMELNKQDGIVLKLSGQFEGKCFSLATEIFDILEAAKTNGHDVALDILGREHSSKEGEVVPVVQAIYDVPTEDEPETEVAF